MKPYENCFKNPEYGWDAIDCLFAFGYDLRKTDNNPITISGGYKLALWGKAVTSKEQKSIDLLLKELEENSGYYTRRINQIGDALL